MYNFTGMGKLIREYRKEKNLSMEELAELCNLSYQCISDVENGLVNPKFITVIRIFFVLDKDLNELKQYVALETDGIYHKKFAWLKGKPI